MADASEVGKVELKPLIDPVPYSGRITHKRKKDMGLMLESGLDSGPAKTENMKNRAMLITQVRRLWNRVGKCFSVEKSHFNGIAIQNPERIRGAKAAYRS